jgi:hypothetical protein
MEMLIPLFGIIVPFVTAFGIIYIIYTTRHRERMNMIDKGMDPQLAKPAPDPLRSMRNGLVLLGLGLGLVAGWLFHQHAMDPKVDTPLPYLAGPAIFAGVALILFYVKFGKAVDAARPE